jgi:hypothetical protein
VLKNYPAIVVCVLVAAIVASSASASTQPKIILKFSTSKSIPDCVKPNQHIKLAITFTNVTTALTESITARFGYVTSAKNADQNSLVIAPGTDPLLGNNGNKHWSFKHKQKAVLTKHLVALVQPVMDQKSSPPRWGFTMLVSVAGANQGPGALRVSRPYCPPAPNA